MGRREMMRGMIGRFRLWSDLRGELGARMMLCFFHYWLRTQLSENVPPEDIHAWSRRSITSPQLAYFRSSVILHAGLFYNGRSTYS